MNTEASERILLVVTKSNFGGAQRYVYELAVALQERGHDVAIASGGTTGELIDKLHTSNITHLPIHSFQRDINLFKEVRATLELSKYIRSFQPTVLHVNSSKAGGLGAMLGRLLWVPTIIFTAHGWQYHEPRSWLSRRLTYWLSWLTGMFAHRVITVSEHDQKTAPVPFVRSKCIVIPTGTPPINWLARNEAQTELNITPANTVIQVGTVAELTNNKNILFAIEGITAFNQAHTGTTIAYTVMGDGEDREKLQQYIDSHNLEYVTLAGVIPDARRYLTAFDAFLLPSLKEGMPYALLEAAAAGLPLIASNRGGISEIINDPETGLLIDPTDPSTLQSALATITDAVTRTKLGAAALERSNDFTLNKMIDRTITVYESKIASSAKADSRAID